MIPVNATYQVYDKENRYWGDVELKYPFNKEPDLIEGGTVSGYLKPSDEFYEIKKIYKRFEEINHGQDDLNTELDNLMETISSFGVVLRDSSNNRYRVGPVFVSATNLFTCQAIENEQI